MAILKSKAKRKGDGQWVFGYAVPLSGGVYIITPRNDTDIYSIPMDMHPVDPYTVCMDSGKVDVANQVIYQSDIIEWKETPNAPINKDHVVYVNGVFKLNDFRTVHYITSCHYFRVVGNIHDKKYKGWFDPDKYRL